MGLRATELPEALRASQKDLAVDSTITVFGRLDAVPFGLSSM
jgi:hypothetical protein